MSALGQKRTSEHVQSMSALPPTADIGTEAQNVRYVPKADVSNRSKAGSYSITSSVVASSDDGTVRPRMRAVSTLMTSSNLVACTTGKSAGFSPLRMRPM